MSDVAPFIVAWGGGSWCLLRAYILVRRDKTEAAIPFLFAGASGYVIGGIGAITRLLG